MELQGRTASVAELGEVSVRAPQWCFMVRGAHIVMYPKLQDAQRVAEKIVSAGGMAITFEPDVIEKSALNAMVAKTGKQYGMLTFW